MISESIWKKVWLFFGIAFLSIGFFMIFFAPVLASFTGTAPFSDRARAMISFFWVWMIIYNGIGNFLLYKNMEKYEILIILGIPAGFTFTILQISFLVMQLFEFVISEVIWAIIPSIWSIICVIYLNKKRKK